MVSSSFPGFFLGYNRGILQYESPSYLLSSIQIIWLQIHVLPVLSNNFQEPFLVGPLGYGTYTPALKAPHPPAEC